MIFMPSKALIIRHWQLLDERLYISLVAERHLDLEAH